MAKTKRDALSSKASQKWSKQRKHLDMDLILSAGYEPKRGIPLIRGGLVVEGPDGYPHAALRRPNKNVPEREWVKMRMQPDAVNRLVYNPKGLTKK